MNVKGFMNNVGEFTKFPSAISNPMIRAHVLNQKVGDMSKKALALFEDVPNEYDEWLDGFVPDHPYFDKDALIQAVVLTIKDVLFHKILNGCAELLKALHLQNADQSDILTISLSQNQVLWKAIISGHKYGVIYLCSRTDALNLDSSVIQQCPTEARLINEFLSQDSSAIRAINYGVRQFIHDDRIQTTLAARFVPPHAIAAIGKLSRSLDREHNGTIFHARTYKTHRPRIRLQSHLWEKCA